MQNNNRENILTIYNNAYTTLLDVVDKENLSQLEQDGVIQRFEYTIELSWKTLRKIYDIYGIDYQNYAKAIFATASSLGIITDLSPRGELRDARNELSHSYDYDTAHELLNEIIRPHAHHFPDLENNIRDFITKQPSLG